MRRKSAQTITTKTGDYVNFHVRLPKTQYEDLWDMADENNTDISALVKQAIDYMLGKRLAAKMSITKQGQ